MQSNSSSIVQQAMTAILQQGRDDQIDFHLASDFVGNDTAGKTFTRDDFRQGVREVLRAFSERDLEIADQFAAGDQVVVRWNLVARHSGPFQGIPATGKTCRITGILIARFAAGKMIESWEVTDDLGLIRQLGVEPGMPASVAAD